MPLPVDDPADEAPCLGPHRGHVGGQARSTVERYEPGLTESSERRRRASEGRRGDFCRKGCLFPQGGRSTC